MPHYLGLDSSTQSLSAVIIDTDSGTVEKTLGVHYGSELPEFGCENGFLPHPDPNVVHADPLLWAAALDKIFAKLRAQGYDLSQIRGVSGAGQQHGSVYLSRKLEAAPRAEDLVSFVSPWLSRKTAPIWMDSSTGAECAEIARAVGGDDYLIRVTGSSATRRFTGPQIRAFYRREPAAYEQTREIHLVSSFIASLLTHRSCPIDLGDGSGMNLLDLARAQLDPKLLEATAPDLGSRLPGVCPSATIVGHLSDYFVDKYGFAKGTPVVAFTGDNPSSLVGMGATEPGVAVISLGTSDTFFAAMKRPLTDPRGLGHVFGNPAGGFMSLICFSNGSLAREAVKNELGVDWDAFSRAILETPSGANGNWMLPYFVPEATPPVPTPTTERFGNADFIAGKLPGLLARSIVEIQAVTMMLHSRWIGETPSQIAVTGGASKNAAIRQVFADVFQAQIVPLSVDNSSALGGAIRAAHVIGKVPLPDLYGAFCSPDVERKASPAAAPGTYHQLEQQLATELARRTV